ncbi:LacI family DNA-binding transcriptional regulator [Lacisediminihabitans sp. H27-G8]|uniref:LacI family DNA-binding transcriptional regulator n=1 Tax=Lacisediminihabitans sp. H27-G8 TaxID=3111909 RepID=UPI0038FC8F82
MKQSGNEAPLTIRDVALHAGVSRATASRALSDYGVVNSETRDKVRRSAETLGYVPNVLARSMRAGKTQTIGLIITEVGLSVFDLAMRAVIDAAHRKGYQVLVSNTNEDLSAERDSMRIMLEKQVDGVILVPSAVHDLRFISPDALKGKPVTLLDRTLDSLDLPSVSADNRTGARDALDHFRANGHTRIGLVVVTANIHGQTSVRPDGLVSTLHDRTEGYLEGMAAAGLPVGDDWVWFAADGGETARQAVRSILDSADPPTAILGSNANVSLAMLSVAKERGLTVGVDISYIGFDDAPWAPVLTPGLTVVDLPIEAMAEAAVENLVAQIASGDADTARETALRSVVLPMRLVVRGSVGPVSGTVTTGTATT